MITFERSFDYDGVIRRIMTHPKVYSQITDDFSPACEDFQPIEHEALWYVIVRDGSELLGLWMFHPQNTICWEVHTALLPSAWGARALQAALELPEWIWEHTPCRRIVTNVPALNRVAYHFALAAQMVEYGRNERSILKHGILQDQICLGISKPLTAADLEMRTEQAQEAIATGEGL